jgi:integral membrane protein
MRAMRDLLSRRTLGTELGQFRVISLLEGLSFLVLLGVAMPIKYAAGDPSWVQVLGPVHGVLFVLFVLALSRAASAAGWAWPRVASAFVASVVPFGALWLELRLRREAPAA